MPLAILNVTLNRGTHAGGAIYYVQRHMALRDETQASRCAGLVATL